MGPNAVSHKSSVKTILDIFVEPTKLEKVISALVALPESISVYEVTGRSDIVVVIQTGTIDEFRDVLVKKICKIDGMKSTVSSIVLQEHGPNVKTRQPRM